MPDSNEAKRPEFRTSRTFDAPRALVFEAWTKAEHLSRWFTPRPLTTKDCAVDFRAGGVFRLVMAMPNGLEHPMDAKFEEIVPLERIVFSAKIDGNNELMTTVTFSEANGKTTLDVHQTYSFESDSTRGAPQGWKASLDQLGEVVAEL